MSQIEELQGRLAAALDRIGQGLERMAPEDAADPAEVAALRQDLDDERIACEQLRERVKALKAQRDRLDAELEAARAGALDIGRLDSELQGLRAANEKLREINDKLRAANAGGVAEPGLIDAAMQAELDALRAERAAERAETGAILGELSEAVKSAAAGQRAEGA